MNTTTLQSARRADEHVAPILTKLLTSRETAAVLRVCERTLFSLTDRGELPAVRIGSRKLYVPGDVARYIEAMRTRHDPAWAWESKGGGT